MQLNKLETVTFERKVDPLKAHKLVVANKIIENFYKKGDISPLKMKIFLYNFIH